MYEINASGARALRRASFWLVFWLALLSFGCASETSSDVASDLTSSGEQSSDPSSSQTPAEDSTAEPSESAAVEKKPKKKKERPASVTVAEVVRRDLVAPVNAEGSIRARHASDLKFELAGRVSRVHVREGQRVRRGQTLVSLDDRELQLALEEAQSRYLKALGQLAVEEDGYKGAEGAERRLAERAQELQELEDSGEISRRERLDRELEIGMAAVRDGAYRRELIEVRSGLAAARMDADRLKIELEKMVVKATFNGVISGLELDPGERVQVGQKVCRLVDDIRVEAAVGLLESDLATVEVGRRVLLSLPALETSVLAQVDVIDPEVDAESRTCRLLMRLENRDGKVKPGMFVRAAIAGRVFEDRLLVPREAVVTRDGRPVVFGISDGRAQWIYVELGEQNDRWVEIASVLQGGPLEAGSPVIIDNHLTLSHDAKVKIKKTLEIEDPWAENSAE